MRSTLTLLILFAAPALAQVPNPVLDDAGSPVLYPSYLTIFDNQLYFRGSTGPQNADTELWHSDGTRAWRAADIVPGNSGSSPADLAVYNDKLYFAATDSGGATKLWQYDPANGASLAPGSSSQAGLPQEMTAYNGLLYFRAFRSNIGIELWKFDGSAQTPVEMFPGSGSSYPQHFIRYNSNLYFNANGTPGQGTELWNLGPSGIPTEAARIYPNNGSSPEQFAIFNNKLYFSAYDGVHGRELWSFDGSTASLAADIVPGGQYDSSNPNNMAAYNGKLYFSAYDPTHGFELWSFDGTSAKLAAEINFTPDPGNGDTFLMDSSPANLTVFNGLLYFSADDGVHGRELWSFDGTTASLVRDINPGPYGSDVSELIVYNGQLFFSADDGYNPALGSLQPRLYAMAGVPEPQTLGILGLIGLGLLRRRRA